MDAAKHATPQIGTQLFSQLLHAAAQRKQCVIADMLGVDKSTVGRWLTGETAIPLDRACALIAAAGLVLQPESVETVTVSTSHYQSLITLAGERMANLQKGWR